MPAKKTFSPYFPTAGIPPDRLATFLRILRLSPLTPTCSAGRLPLDCLLTSGSWNDFASFCIAQSRWARLAGFGFPNDCFGLCFILPGETELGNAEEQPNKG